MNLQEKLNEAFGFNVEIISTKQYAADPINKIGPRMTISVKRPNGKKWYHAIQYENGAIVRSD